MRRLIPLVATAPTDPPTRAAAGHSLWRLEDLTPAARRFLAECLMAVDDRDALVAEIAARCGVKLDRAQVRVVDPSELCSTREDLEALRAFAMQRIEADLRTIAAANVPARLRHLDRVARRAERTGNPVLAAAALQLAAGIVSDQCAEAEGDHGATGRSRHMVRRGVSVSVHSADNRNNTATACRSRVMESGPACPKAPAPWGSAPITSTGLPQVRIARGGLRRVVEEEQPAAGIPTQSQPVGAARDGLR